MDQTRRSIAEELIAQAHETARRLRESLQLRSLLPAQPMADATIRGISNIDMTRIGTTVSVPSEPVDVISSVEEVDAWLRAEVGHIQELFGPLDDR